MMNIGLRNVLRCTLTPPQVTCLSSPGRNSTNALSRFLSVLPYQELISLRPTHFIICRSLTIGTRHYAAGAKDSGSTRKSSAKRSSLVETSEQQGAVTLSLGEKVKENAKTATYGGVILLGLAVTGAMAYVILSELFSSDSPNNIYTKSFKLCKANLEVQDSLGTPIKCYGEETRRGWRRHVAHQEFFHGNTKILRMRFYVEGQFKKGTVHVEKKTNDKGKYEYSYLMVDVDGYPPRRIEIDVSNF